MSNFNPSNHDNVINPYTLSKVEQEEIIRLINDNRLSNPPGEYFKLQMDGRVIDIPKLKNISLKTSKGKIRSISVTDFITQKLTK
jgi:hypothetical protein